MRALWVLGGPVSPQYYLDAIPTGMTVGAGKPAGFEHDVPIVVIEYDEPDLTIMALLAEQMERVGLSPAVHIWNLEEPAPEIALAFSLEKEVDGFFKRAKAASYTDPAWGFVGPSSCKRIIAGAGANGYQDQIKRFITCFRQTGVVMVQLCKTVRPGDAHYQEALAVSTRTVKYEPFRMVVGV